MVTTAILFSLLAVATYTDWRDRKIYNRTTYPGMGFALIANGAATLLAIDSQSGSEQTVALWGLIGIQASLLGLVSCGAVMLVCYVFFPGGVGGGDVKLIAMVGAWLGVYDGLEAMLWTFVIGGCMALISLVWRVGVWKLIVHGTKYVLLTLRFRSPVPLSPQEREPLRTQLFLSPSALLATGIVRFRLLEWF